MRALWHKCAASALFFLAPSRGDLHASADNIAHIINEYPDTHTQSPGPRERRQLFPQSFRRDAHAHTVSYPLASVFIMNKLQRSKRRANRWLERELESERQRARGRGDNPLRMRVRACVLNHRPKIAKLFKSICI